MTASLDPETPWTRFATRIAHWHPVITITILVGLFVAPVLGGPTWISVVLILAYFATSYITGGHLYALCSRCAARTPLDPEAAVKRHHRALSYTHRTRRTALTIYLPVAAVLVAAIFIQNLVVAWLYALALVVFYVDSAIGSYALLRHRTLQPWCPWCRHWRDDDEDTPAPQPVPTGEATR